MQPLPAHKLLPGKEAMADPRIKKQAQSTLKKSTVNERTLWVKAQHCGAPKILFP